MHLKLFFTSCILVIFAVSLASAAAAQTQLGDGNVVVGGSVQGSITIQFASKVGTGPRADNAGKSQDARSDFYALIMAYLRTQPIKRGRFSGKLFRDVYASAAEPKALAICINWNQSVPGRLNIKSSASFQFITGSGDCAPRNEVEAERCVMDECRAHGKCASSQRCVLVDVNGKNFLAVPDEWLKRHTK